jgi:hypothetical protein
MEHELRFRVAPRLITSSRRWQVVSGLAAFAAMGVCVAGVLVGSRSFAWGALWLVLAACCLLAYRRLGAYSRDLGRGLYDIVLDEKALVLPINTQVARIRLLEAKTNRLPWAGEAQLVLITSDPRRTYKIDLRRFEEGDRIASEIERWRNAEIAVGLRS